MITFYIAIILIISLLALYLKRSNIYLAYSFIHYLHYNEIHFNELIPLFFILLFSHAFQEFDDLTGTPTVSEGYDFMGTTYKS